MSLHLHRSERADPLVEALAALLSISGPDPFAPEVVAVPARGVERWLAQRLSRHLGSGEAGDDGVCANVWFPSPSDIAAEAVAKGSGVDPSEDPWAPGRVVWALLDVIDHCGAEPWCSALARQSAASAEASTGAARRFVAAQHLGGLFASYAQQRPQLLRDWIDGDDTDGAESPLDDDLLWQAELWRRLRNSIGLPSPAERLDAACAALRREPGLVDLPPRLSVFGPTRLTTDQVAVLSALAEHRDVHLWMLHPSAALWDKVAPLAALEHDASRRGDPTRSAVDHPLLLSLGRDAREMQLLLGAPSSGAHASDQHHPVRADRSTLLGRLQRDLRRDTAPPGVPVADVDTDVRPVLATDDRSLQVHACHGRDRQVEVLREVLLGLLETDATLEPRDVLVMCPDIETYAPFISATFGLADSEAPPAHPGHGLRVRLADRSLRQTNPILSTVAELLELADARVTASQVLDLAASQPVRRRFGFDDEDLERASDWVRTSGVRWGLDAAHRAPFHLETITQNTWRAGLDRILLGVTMSDDDLRWLGLALPLDDVDSNDVDLAGRLAEYVDRLAAALDSLTDDQPLAEWVAALGDAVDALTAVCDGDAWQLAQARRELAEVVAGAADRAVTVDLSLADVRALLADKLTGRPTRAGFRTGDLTMCSMVPMRSVPHRVVCLLGLDDGAFPRTTAVDGDDILARDPRVGERDRRSEDRQVLLDAIHAARETLVVIYAGADDRTNSERPPAVPVGEVLDVVDATVRTADGRPASDQVVVRHPLQPFDPRNFEPGELGRTGPFSFDSAALAGAMAATRPRRDAPPFLAEPLPAAPAAETVELDQLIGFLEHPVRGFLRQRLGVALPDEGDELDDAMHAELAPLTKWSVGDRWLRDRLGGADADTCVQAEWRRGELPPGALGASVLGRDIEPQAESLLSAAAAYRHGDAESVDISVAQPDGRMLTGTVAGIHGSTLVRIQYSKLAPKHRLRAWMQVLALAAAKPERSWGAVTVGRGVKPGVATSVLEAPPADEAAATLAALVRLRDRGLCEPLPLPVGTAWRYAQLRRLGTREQLALRGAAREWTASFEQADGHHRLVFGPDPDVDVLLSAAASPDEQAVGATDAERTRFGALACMLWWPLLAAETLQTP